METGPSGQVVSEMDWISIDRGTRGHVKNGVGYLALGLRKGFD